MADSALTTKPYRVLVAVRDPGKRHEIAHLIRKLHYPVLVAGSIHEAIEKLRSRTSPSKPDVFLAFFATDLNDGGSWDDLLEAVHQNAIETYSVLVCDPPDIRTAVEAIKGGAFDVITPPVHLLALRDVLERGIQKRIADMRHQEIIRLRERQKLNAAHHTEFMLSIARIIDAKSPYTNQHSLRVGALSRALAEEIGIEGQDLARIELGGQLHDIGKIGIPEAILNKEGPLTPDEYEIIKTHPTLGAELVKPVSLMSSYIPMILWHHENLDGTGYPDGLAGDDIPLEAQIVKVADTFDALTSARPYRSALSTEKVMNMLRPCAGTTINGDLLSALDGLLKCRNKREEVFVH